MAYYRQTRFGIERLESRPLTPPKKRQRTTKAKASEPKQQAQAEQKADKADK